MRRTTRSDRAMLRQIRFTTPSAAAPLLAAVASLDQRGSINIVGLGPGRRYVGSLSYPNAEGHEERLVHAGATVADGDVTAILMITNRTGQRSPRKRKDHERWDRMHECASEHGVELLDWIAVYHRRAISLAEGASTPAAWAPTPGGIAFEQFLATG